MGAPTGERNGNGKLTASDVRLIRSLMAERERLMREASELTVEKIAEKFEVSPVAVYKIRQFRTWAHIT